MPFHLDWFGWALGTRARYSHFPTDSVSTYRFKTLLLNGFFSSLHITPDEQENRKPGVFLLEKKKIRQGFKRECRVWEGSGRCKTPGAAGSAWVSSSSCSFAVSCLELNHLTRSPRGSEGHSSQASAGFTRWVSPGQAVTMSLLTEKPKWCSWMTLH